MFINGSVYCLLIASSKVVHSSASLEDVFTTCVVLFTCSCSGNLSSIIAKILGNFFTSTFSSSVITEEITLTTGTLLSISKRDILPVSKLNSGFVVFSTVSTMAVSCVGSIAVSLLTVVQPDVKPIVAASAIKRPLKPLAFIPPFLFPENAT